MDSDISIKFSTDFNKRLEKTLQIAKKQKRSTSRIDPQKDIGAEDRRKVREYNLMVRKLHEATSAMTVLENVIKTHQDIGPEKDKEIADLKRNRDELIQQLEHSTRKREEELEFQTQLTEQLSQLKQRACIREQQLLKQSARLEEDLKRS